jgi:hypothetical protein
MTRDTAKIIPPELIARAEEGEKIKQMRCGRLIGDPVRIGPAPTERHFGTLRDLVTVGQAYFEPLPDDEMAFWE